MVASDTLRVAGLHELIGGTADVHHITAPELLRSPDFDIAVLDEPSEDLLLATITTLRRARSSLRIIALGANADPEVIQRVIASGAKGYLNYTATAQEVQMCITVVMDGSVWAPRKVLARLLDKAGPEPRRHSEPYFTPREREVLNLLAEGNSNREIGDALGIDIATVKAHVSRLMRKVGVDNRVALTLKTLENNRQK
ncbi:MAG: response regulator transcription factor [Acidobacteria bacterium]|nr:response regulator transcription factor [Acidobacteriota bacterium]